MDSKVPRFYEFFNPILEVMKDGKEYHRREIFKKLREHMGLPEGILEERVASG